MIDFCCGNLFVWFIEYQYLLCHIRLQECIFNLKLAERQETHWSEQMLVYKF